MINVSRLQNDRDLLTPVTLQYVSQRSDVTSGPSGAQPGPVDIIYLTERLWAITLEQVGDSLRLVSSGVLG